MILEAFTHCIPETLHHLSAATQKIMLFAAYDLNLIGVEVIRESAEILASALSIESIKLFFLLLIGFMLALHGINTFVNGVRNSIERSGSDKTSSGGAKLIFFSFLLISIGLAIIFNNELRSYLLKKTSKNQTTRAHMCVDHRSTK